MSKPKNMTTEEEKAWKVKQNSRRAEIRAMDSEGWRMKELAQASRRKAKDPIRFSEIKRANRAKNIESARASARKSAAKAYRENPQKAIAAVVWYQSRNREKIIASRRNQRGKLPNWYVAERLKLPLKLAKSNLELIEAKREQIKILRELKPTNRKQTQCTRIQATC